jgi:uncharacterized Zn finger protein
MRRIKMFKCPECGSTDRFKLDVIADAVYDQTYDSIEELWFADWSYDGCVHCEECGYDGDFDEFQVNE